MTKLKVSTYQGFKMGMRIADRFALTADVHNSLDVTALHAIKNLANVDKLERALQAFSINGDLYVR